jgi:hypothetical protein
MRLLVVVKGGAVCCSISYLTRAAILLIEHNALIMSVQFFLMFNLEITLSWEMELLA